MLITANSVSEAAPVIDISGAVFMGFAGERSGNVGIQIQRGKGRGRVWIWRVRAPGQNDRRTRRWEAAGKRQAILRRAADYRAVRRAEVGRTSQGGQKASLRGDAKRVRMQRERVVYVAKKTGRPSKYDESVCEALLRYFSKKPYRVRYRWTKNAETGEREKTPEEEIPTDFPTIEGFCAKAGISKDTFYRWVGEHKEFSDAFAQARARQTEILVVNGLRGNYNPGFAQFVAINCLDGFHSTKNKNENEESGEIRVVFGGEDGDLAK